MAASLSTLVRRSGRLQVNPLYREFLEHRGLTTAADFLALTGVIVCGHPNRHVLRVTLGGEESFIGFLKREHRVPWLGRLTNALAGFGFVSHSCREGQVLRELRRAGVSGPEWIAAGEDRDGRAFLLVRELTGTIDLRLFLQGQPDVVRRRCLARNLGEALAHVHDAGFDHPDLYAKHVLVDSRSRAVHIIDWQRSRRRRDVSWFLRWRDLAALHATLAPELASLRERLACLRAYLKATLPRSLVSAAVRRAIQHITQATQRLLRHRHIREQRQPLLPGVAQRLIWLDGEALCVTPELHAMLNPEPSSSDEEGKPLDAAPQRLLQAGGLPGPFQATLVRRRADWHLRSLWAWLRGKQLQSCEVRQAALLFRLQRYGVQVPRLFAFGQKHFPLRRTESFLLTQALPHTSDLADWLTDEANKPRWTAQRKKRWRLIREVAGVLHQLHEARCFFERNPTALPLQVQAGLTSTPAVVLGSVQGLFMRRRARSRHAVQDLAKLRDALPRQAYSRTDALRFLLSYLGEPHLTPAVSRLFRQLDGGNQRSLLARFFSLFRVFVSPCLPVVTPGEGR